MLIGTPPGRVTDFTATAIVCLLCEFWILDFGFWVGKVFVFSFRFFAKDKNKRPSNFPKI
jgi:hypothetical protein